MLFFLWLWGIINGSAAGITLDVLGKLLGIELKTIFLILLNCTQEAWRPLLARFS